MKILCINPPYIPSYFNAGHHLPIFQVAAYLENVEDCTVDCIDAGLLNYTWRDICSTLIKRYDLIVVLNDFDTIDSFRRFIKYVKEISPNSRTLTFGRLSKKVPRFFQEIGFDAIVQSGDYEAGVHAYVQYLLKKNDQPLGLLFKKDENYIEYGQGIFLEPTQWVFPDIEKIPYFDHNRLYKNDLNKFCGIPERTELVVPIARGCPINCSFCDVPEMQGTKERRVSVDEVIKYIKASFDRFPFEYISFYAPTFTLSKRWVMEFCTKLQNEERNFPWKCVTTTNTLDEDLIRVMAESGCIRISIGVETFCLKTQENLPKSKRQTKEEVKLIADWCSRYGIELNCFIIVGLPDSTIESTKETMDILLSYNVRVRPTVYAPYHLLADGMDEEQIQNFNRQLFYPDDDLTDQSKLEGYKLLYANEKDKETQVMTKIKKSEEQVVNLI